MIRHRIDQDGRAFKIGKDGREVGVELITNFFILQKGVAIFSAEDEVNVDFGERLRHGSSVAPSGLRFWVNAGPGALPRAGVKLPLWGGDANGKWSLSDVNQGLRPWSPSTFL